MHWNHRVIEYVDPTTEETWLGIHEVHYDEQNRPMSYTEDPMAVVGEDRAELIVTLERMRAAIDKPWLREIDFNRSPSEDASE